jgi:hypothetical protein
MPIAVAVIPAIPRNGSATRRLLEVERALDQALMNQGVLGRAIARRRNRALVRSRRLWNVT